MSDAPWLSRRAIERVAVYLDSHRRFVGRELLPRTSAEADALTLFEAPFVAVAHGIESDPIFDYGNRRALELWEFSWSEFVALPSRFSAEPAAREERERLLAEVRERGFSTGYSGIRATRSGRRFRILDVTVWNVVDEEGTRVGQGAAYERFEWI